jgi:hypothetical protein
VQVVDLSGPALEAVKRRYDEWGCRLQLAMCDGNFLALAGCLTKQNWETILFALAPNNKGITATSDARFFLNCKEVIDALAKAGALALASKLESKCRHQ